MNIPIRLLVILAMSLLVIACSKTQGVGGGYQLVRAPDSLNPDAHPGTFLRHENNVVWRNVYAGYLDGQAPSHFFHHDVFLFVGPVPDGAIWYPEPQLFAVRGDGPPVVLTPRLVGQPLVVSDLAGEGSTFEVTAIRATDEGVHIALEYYTDPNTKATRKVDLTWMAVEQLLEEASASGKTIHSPLGDYLVLAPQ